MNSTVIVSVRASEALDRAMFHFLQKQGPQSPYTLAEEFNTGRGTIYEAIKRMEGSNLIERSTLLTGRVGRPPVVVRVRNLNQSVDLEKLLAQERRQFRGCMTCAQKLQAARLPCRRCLRHPQMKDHYSPR
jgi:predicted transcriptional regulator